MADIQSLQDMSRKLQGVADRLDEAARLFPQSLAELRRDRTRLGGAEEALADALTTLASMGRNDTIPAARSLPPAA